MLGVRLVCRAMRCSENLNASIDIECEQRCGQKRFASAKRSESKHTEDKGGQGYCTRTGTRTRSSGPSCSVGRSLRPRRSSKRRLSHLAPSSPIDQPAGFLLYIATLFVCISAARLRHAPLIYELLSVIIACTVCFLESRISHIHLMFRKHEGQSNPAPAGLATFDVRPPTRQLGLEPTTISTVSLSVSRMAPC